MPLVLVPREAAAAERRVAATPETARALVDLGVEVGVQSGAGVQAGFTDEVYEEAGATITPAGDGSWAGADVVLTVGPPRPQNAALLPEGAVLIGLLAAHRHPDLVRTLVDRKVTALTLEQVPRISRAQRMDALSSQANIAGYRAAIMAAYLLDKHFPLAMTAAGTIRPATVVVLGAGVAGLQAIATCRRLGAVVRANDIRAPARGEVESLGADFIDLEAEATRAGAARAGATGAGASRQDAGGYATEVGADFLALQRQVLGRHLADAHAVITTAVIPGRPAPRLVTREMVEGMRPGSVLIDLAAAEGGNCELTPEEGEVRHGDVRIVAAADLASQMPGESSALYARNLLALLRLLLEGQEAGQVQIDRSDEIVAAVLLTIDGTIVAEPIPALAGQRVEGTGA